MTTAPDVSGKLLPPCNHRRSGQGPTAQPCSIAQNTIGCVDRHSVPPHILPILAQDMKLYPRIKQWCLMRSIKKLSCFSFNLLKL